mgnify:CR=1 FL=1
MPACARPPAKRRDNERLEFLGDRVLGLAIAELLSEVYPAASEGELARLYNRLVRGGTCAEVARAARSRGLAGAERVGSRQRRARQGDDPGRCLRGAARRHLPGGRLRQGARRSCASTGAGKLEGSPAAETADAKSALQEWAQGQGLDLPHYVEVARQGPDHAPRFTSEVRIKGTKPARGEGANKRAAEQAAATALLAREGVWGARHR